MTIMQPSQYSTTPYAPATAPPRPPQLVLTAVLVAGCAGILLGLTALVVWHVLNFESELIAELPLLVLIPGLLWTAFLVPALLRGRPWSRLATAVTVPIQIPFYLLYLSVLVPTVTDPDLADSPKAGWRAATLVFCALGVALAAMAPLFLIGGGVRAYLQRPR